jgi:hypothetical protein
MLPIKSGLATILCTLITVPLASQVLQIVPSATHALQTQWRSPIHLPVRCDEDGNVYFRSFQPGTTASPVVRVSLKRENVTSFSLASEPDFKRASVQDFAVTPQGQVFELIQVGDDVYIGSFSDDGSLKSKTRLEKQFWSAHLGVIAGGSRFVVAGSELPVKNGAPPGLVTAIFDDSGRLLKKLAFKHDPAELKEPRAGDPKIQNYLADQVILPLVSGDTQVGVNGDLFVMRASNPPQVFVLNSSGELVRKITVETPESGMALGSMQLSSSRLAALFYKADASQQLQKRVMVIVDINRGTMERSYHLADGLGGGFACYDGSSFTFLTTEGEKLAITTAKPE